jgi:Heterokaryon incompatibility protein (HET)
MPITRNLAEALDHLSISDRPRKLWVDALCINQKDYSEKSQQIQKVKDIYARAKRVVVFIGVLGMVTQHLLQRLDSSEDEGKLPSRLSRWMDSQWLQGCC